MIGATINAYIQSISVSFCFFLWLAGQANDLEVHAPSRTGLVSRTWVEVTRNALNSIVCLDKDCTHEKRGSFFDMLEYTTHLVEAHPGIRTSFTENVLHVQEPTDFVNPDIPVSHSIQYSHRMSEDQPPIPPTSSSYHVQPPTDPIDATLISETPPDMADRVFDYNSPKDSIVSFIPYIPPEIVPVPSKSTVIPYGHSIHSPSNVSHGKKTRTYKKWAPKPQPPLPYTTKPAFRVKNTLPMSTLGVDAPDTTVHDDALIVELSSVPVNATPPNDIPTIVDLPVVDVNTSPPKKKVSILLVRLPRDIEATFHVYCSPPSSSHGSESSQTHVEMRLPLNPALIFQPIHLSQPFPVYQTLGLEPVYLRQPFPLYQREGVQSFVLLLSLPFPL